jgi:futalosine hydrolase
MNILVVAATEMEIAPFIAENRFVDVLITGVGAPACMYSLTKQLQQSKYDYVVQAGIAGTFKNMYALGETFAVKSDVFADIGVQEKGNYFTLFEKGFMQADSFPYTNGMLLNENIGNHQLQALKAITINTITDNFEQSEMFRKKFDADIESMEGAAFHYVCIQEKIPFLQLRSISNFVGERIKTNWKMKEAVQSLNENLSRIIVDLA